MLAYNLCLCVKAAASATTAAMPGRLSQKYIYKYKC